MVGRRKRGSNSLKLIAILFVVIGIGSVVAILTTPVGDLLVEASDEVKELVNGWVIDGAFTFATAPNGGVSCTLKQDLEFVYALGNRVIVDSKTVSVPVVTVFRVTSPTDDLAEIKNIDIKAEVTCVTIGATFPVDVVGGSVEYKWITRNEAGALVTVKQEAKLIPSIARNALNGVGLPVGRVFATEIENSVNLQNTQERTVPITVETSYNILFKTGATGDLWNSGQQMSSAGGTVKIIDDSVPPPPPMAGRNVDITAVIPSQINYVNDPSGSNEIGDGDVMTLRVTGELDDWTVSEGNPFINIRTPTGQGLLLNRGMSAIFVSGSITQFSTGNFQVNNLVFRDSNIANFDGQWIAEMHSANDNRAVADSMTFAVVDARGIAPPLPPSTCDLPLVPDGMGGCKLGEEPIIIPTITCPSISDMGIFITSATNAELLAKKAELDELKAQGNTQTCVTNFLNFVNQEIAVRGVTVTPPPTTGTSSVNAFIEYLSAHAPKGSEQSGCTIPSSGTVGRLPTSGISITGFQLLGFGTCDGNIWQNTQIDVVLDFGDDVKEFVQDTSVADLEHRLIISVNNPFPTNPTFICIQGSNPSILPICSLEGHNFLNDKVGSVGLRFDEVAEPNVFVDQQGGDPRLRLADVNLQNNAIKDKIQKDHILLQGDKVEVLYYTWGKFGGTFKGTDVVGAFTPLHFIQKFTWDDTGVQTKCPDGETLRADRTCKPESEDICELPNKRDVNGVCRAPTKTTTTNGQTTMEEGLICEASLEVNQPVCTAEQNPVPTGETDACDLPFFECKAKDDPNVVDKPDVDNGMPREVDPNADGGCPAMYTINTATGKCQIIGGGDLDGDGDPDGGGGSGGVCDLATFNFGSCFAKIIQDAQAGLPSFNIPSGIEPIIFLGIAVGVIILIAVGIIIRRRKSSFGGGF